MANENLKKVKLGTGLHEVEALHFKVGDLDTPTQWKNYIDQIAELGFDIVKLDTLPAANAQTYETYHNKIVLVPNSSAQAGECIEYVILREGSSGSYTYKWEQIGSTKVNFPGATQPAGKHSHTVSATSGSSQFVTGVSSTSEALAIFKKSDAAVGADGTAAAITGFGTHPTKSVLPGNATINPGKTSKKLSLKKNSGGGFSPCYATVLESITPTKQGLAKESVTGVSGSVTASKATAGTAITYGTANAGTAVSGIAKRGSQITYGNADKGGEIGAYVSSDGILTFSFNALSAAPTPAAQYGATTSSKTTYGCTSDQLSVVPAVASTTTFTPYTFADVTVPVADSGHNFVTGLGTGSDIVTGVETVDVMVLHEDTSYSDTGYTIQQSDSTGDVSVLVDSAPTINATAVNVLSGLGTPTTANALTGVKMTAQAAYKIADVPSEDGDIEVLIGVSAPTAQVSVSGNTNEVADHTHEIK